MSASIRATASCGTRLEINAVCLGDLDQPGHVADRLVVRQLVPALGEPAVQRVEAQHHWIQQERREEVNKILTGRLASLPA